MKRFASRNGLRFGDWTAMVPRIRVNRGQLRTRDKPMAEHVVPHFHNEPGVPVIEIGAKEFMCVGATPPFDHPHVFLDMGDDNEIICSVLLDALPLQPVARCRTPRGRKSACCR